MSDTNYAADVREPLPSNIVPPAPDTPQPTMQDYRTWSRQQPIQIVPSEARLKKSHSVVDITSHDRTGQKHVIIDRHMVGHELHPGETLRDVEMLTTHVEHFMRLRRQRLGPVRYAANGSPIARQILPTHPVEVLNVRTPKEWEEQHSIAMKAEEDRAKRAEVLDEARARRAHESGEEGSNGNGKPRSRS